MSNPIEYLKGVGPLKGDLLKKELNIFTFGDLLEHFPYRHIDKTEIKKIGDITPATDFIQVAGKIVSCEVMGEK
ncbi:MAG TPA: ATP-dependent DNA helicase RecG, partial [Agriterribacter sp.]|nr:ATP-dependent DNA helicase RecG [Agriterribacter sp.]